jgi:glycosyltransferase involved in cell wall biosynthesis
MRISVIIPTYNRADFLDDCIRSVLDQSMPPEEIIVVDDGSTDSTPMFLDRFEPFLKIIRQENKGVSAARNCGILAAQNDWLAFLDSDDLWLPQKLARQCDLLSRQKEYKICYTDEEWRKNGHWMNPGKRHKKYSGWIYQKCLPLCIISPSSALIHGSVFRTIGLFDERFPACEDYDLWLRISSRFPIYFLDEKLIVKRAGQWPQLSKQHSLDKYRILALEKSIKDGGLSADQSRATRKMLSRKCDVYAMGCLKRGKASEATWAESIKKIYGIQKPD